MDDGFLVCVLYALAHVNEQFQPFARRECMFVAIGGDRDAGDVLHHEVRPTLLRRAGIEDSRDGGVIHQGERLALGFKTRDDFARVHTGFDQLERDAAAHRLFLLSQPDFAHPAFTYDLEQPISPDRCTWGATRCDPLINGGLAAEWVYDIRVDVAVTWESRSVGHDSASLLGSLSA